MEKDVRAAEQERSDVAAARAQWKEQQPSLTPGRLFFLDETSVKTNMVREHGWALRGERLVGSVPHGRRKTSTFIGCLHQGGMEQSSAFSEVAPCVLDGAVNGELFVACVEQQVVPSLARGDVVAMGNPPVHKAAGVRKALEAAGIDLLFLPAYSPDLNPIETVFAKMKAVLRKAALRTVDALWRALGKVAQPLTREECVNYLRHCGYSQSG